jgi:uncharacterized protein (DUF433 family)
MSWDGTRSPVEPKIRDEIILMIEDGWSDEEILECFPGVERSSVTAFRAHLTRGTYDGLSQGKSKIGV